jgi:hypothetical protein
MHLFLLLLLLGLLGLALYALAKIDLKRVRFELRAWPIKLLFDISADDDAHDSQPNTLPGYPTCYQPFGAHPDSAVVAHAVRTEDPRWSIAGEPLSSPITMQAWPGSGPACPACESALSQHHPDRGTAKNRAQAASTGRPTPRRHLGRLRSRQRPTGGWTDT